MSDLSKIEQTESHNTEQLDSYKVDVDSGNRVLRFNSDHPLSNYYLAPIQIPVIGNGEKDEAEEYLSVQHAYQCMRFDPAEHLDLIYDIKDTPDPVEATRMGELNGDSSVNGWEDIEVSAMEMMMRVKLDQHPEIKRLLLQTEGWTLCDRASKDTFWGLIDGVGENHAGEMLMKIREELLSENTKGLE